MKMSERWLSDGIYLVKRETVILELPDQVLGFLHRIDWEKDEQQLYAHSEIIKEFADKHPTWCIGSAYETNCALLLSEPPTRWQVNNEEKEWYGSGFNYGSTNCLRNLPPNFDILILAQND